MASSSVGHPYRRPFSFSFLMAAASGLSIRAFDCSDAHAVRARVEGVPSKRSQRSEHCGARHCSSGDVPGGF
jgi:hypothetical protein